MKAEIFDIILKQEEYDDTANTWTPKANLNTARMEHVGFAFDAIIHTTVSFSSNPIGATIWIDGADQSVNTPSTISGLTPGDHTYKLVSGIYTATGYFTVITGMTTDVSVTIDVI